MQKIGKNKTYQRFFLILLLAIGFLAIAANPALAQEVTQSDPSSIVIQTIEVEDGSLLSVLIFQAAVLLIMGAIAMVVRENQKNRATVLKPQSPKQSDYIDVTNYHNE